MMPPPSTSAPSGPSRQRLAAIALAVLVLAVVAGANAHLLRVSFASQPDCVPHLKSPDGGAGGFRAAASAC
jgi:hypothetical protein